jgi:hypothetical protein
MYQKAQDNFIDPGLLSLLKRKIIPGNLEQSMVGSCKTVVGSGLASLLLASWQQLGWFSKVGEFSCLGQIKHL